MNAITMAGFNMSRVVETECKANQSIVDTKPAFKNSFISLMARNAAISTLATRQAMNIKGYATNKKEDKKNLALLGNSLAGLIYAFADEKGDTTLRDNMQYSYSGLFYGTADDLVSDCGNIHTALAANAVDMADYGVTPALVVNFGTAITDFANVVPEPRTKQSEKKTDTSNLNKAVSEVKRFMKKQMDKLVVVFDDANPDFVTNYRNARIIVDPRKDKTRMGVHVVDVEGKPIGGATVLLVELGISGVTNSKGILKIVALKHGIYTVQCKATGFTDAQQTEVQVKQGQTTKVEFVMSAPLNPPEAISGQALKGT